MTSWRENLKLCLYHKKVEHPAQQKNQGGYGFPSSCTVSTYNPVHLLTRHFRWYRRGAQQTTYRLEFRHRYVFPWCIYIQQSEIHWSASCTAETLGTWWIKIAALHHSHPSHMIFHPSHMISHPSHMIFHSSIDAERRDYSINMKLLHSELNHKPEGQQLASFYMSAAHFGVTRLFLVLLSLNCFFAFSHNRNLQMGFIIVGHSMHLVPCVCVRLTMHVYTHLH